MLFGRSRLAPLALFLTTALFAATQAGAATALWTPIGPGGGEVRSLVIAPSDSSILFAGTQGGGVFKTVNGAETWTSASRGLRGFAVYALAVHPRNPSIVYAGVLGGGLFKSVDGGASWTLSSRGLPTLDVFSLAIDPRRPSVIYAGTYEHGVFKSTDGGANWLPANRTLRRATVRAVAIHPRNPSIVYIAVSGGPRPGVFKSTDGGATWRAMNNGLPEFRNGFGVFTVVLDPESPDTLYTQPVGERVYRSTDGGGSWVPTQMAGGFPVIVGPSGVLWSGSSEKSYDQGNTVVHLPWNDIFSSEAMAVDPRNPDVAYAGHVFAGISKTVDGRTWQKRNQGLWATTIAMLAVAPENPSTVYTTAVGQGFFRSRNGGRTWRMPVRSAEFGVTRLATNPANPSTLYGVVDEALEKSTDRGTTWRALPVPGASCLSISALAVDPTDPSNVYLSGSDRNGRCPEECRTFRSTDGGESWTCMNGVGGLSGLEIDPQNPSTLYAFNRHLFKSADRGVHWEQIGQGFPETALILAVDPSTPSTLYAGTLEGVYKSVDGGQTWQRSSDGLPRGYILSLAIDPRNSSVLYAGLVDIFRTSDPTPGIALRNIGVYRSTDGGAHWTRFSQGLPPGLFNGLLEIDPEDPDTLYAGTNDGGVYKLAAQTP